MTAYDHPNGNRTGEQVASMTSTLSCFLLPWKCEPHVGGPGSMRWRVRIAPREAEEGMQMALSVAGNVQGTCVFNSPGRYFLTPLAWPVNNGDSVSNFS